MYRAARGPPPVRSVRAGTRARASAMAAPPGSLRGSVVGSHSTAYPPPIAVAAAANDLGAVRWAVEQDAACVDAALADGCAAAAAQQRFASGWGLSFRRSRSSG